MAASRIRLTPLLEEPEPNWVTPTIDDLVPDSSKEDLVKLLASRKSRFIKKRAYKNQVAVKSILTKVSQKLMGLVSKPKYRPEPSCVLKTTVCDNCSGTIVYLEDTTPVCHRCNVAQGQQDQQEGQDETQI